MAQPQVKVVLAVINLRREWVFRGSTRSRWIAFSEVRQIFFSQENLLSRY